MGLISFCFPLVGPGKTLETHRPESRNNLKGPFPLGLDFHFAFLYLGLEKSSRHNDQNIGLILQRSFLLDLNSFLPSFSWGLEEPWRNFEENLGIILKRRLSWTYFFSFPLVGAWKSLSETFDKISEFFVNAVSLGLDFLSAFLAFLG